MDLYSNMDFGTALSWSAMKGQLCFLREAMASQTRMTFALVNGWRRESVQAGLGLICQLSPTPNKHLQLLLILLQFLFCCSNSISLFYSLFFYSWFLFCSYSPILLYPILFLNILIFFLYSLLFSFYILYSFFISLILFLFSSYSLFSLFFISLLFLLILLLFKARTPLSLDLRPGLGLRRWWMRGWVSFKIHGITMRLPWDSPGFPACFHMFSYVSTRFYACFYACFYASFYACHVINVYVDTFFTFFYLSRAFHYLHIG